MSSSYVPAEIRRLVIARAEGICEYCLIHESQTFFGCEVDHIVAQKHGGPTVPENLAFACLFCNRHKGTDLGSILANGELVRFFNPRTDEWADHFRFAPDGILIEPRTPIGEVTVRIFGFNAPEQLIERRTLVASGSYPSPAAHRRSGIA